MYGQILQGVGVETSNNMYMKLIWGIAFLTD